MQGNTFHGGNTVLVGEAKRTDPTPLIDESLRRVAVSCERIEAMTNDARQLGNRLFGLRPEAVSAGIGHKESPEHKGSIRDLEAQIGRLGEAIDEMSSQLQRLEAL